MNTSINKLASGGLSPALNPQIEKLRSGNAQPTQTPVEKPGQGFADILGESLGRASTVPQRTVGHELKFSAHAKARLSSRGIELSPKDILKMQEAVNKAGQKGSRESLILTDKAAFVVSVKNNTVITAVDRESMKDNVFTNIDSTVMI